MYKLVLLLLLLCVNFAEAASRHFGDSITAGYGASNPPVTGYVPLLDAALGLTGTNYATNGSMAADQAIVAHSIRPAASDFSTLMIGVNDCQRYLSVAQQNYYKAFVTDIIVSLTMPNITTARNANVIRSGAWSNSSPLWSTGLQSVTTGNSLTATISGSRIYIGTILQEYMGQAITGTANVLIDGTIVGTVTSNGLAMDTGLGASYGPAAFAFNTVPGSHTIQLVQTTSANPSGSGLNSLYIEYITGSDQLANASLYLSNITQTFQTSNPCPSSSTAIFNGILTGLVSQFSSDGRMIALVDSNSVVLQNDLNTDGIHPNDNGYLKIKNAFMTVIQPPAWIWSGTALWVGQPSGGGVPAYCISPTLPSGACANPLNVP